MLFFFHFSVSPNVFVISTPYVNLGSHPLVFQDSIIPQMEYVAGKCKVMSSSSVVATKGYYLGRTPIIICILLSSCIFSENDLFSNVL